jgi:hypothetical protein
VAITVNAVNDAAGAHGAGAQTSRGHGPAIAGLSVPDTDSSALTTTLTVGTDV